MLGRAAIAALIPHQGAMCLLERVVSWDAAGIACESATHLDLANPLRHGGRLGTVCGAEYGLQAAALHGALVGGGIRQPPGALAALRGVVCHVPRLDDPALGILRIEAWGEGADAAGLRYRFRLTAASGIAVLEGTGLVAL